MTVGDRVPVAAGVGEGFEPFLGFLVGKVSIALVVFLVGGLVVLSIQLDVFFMELTFSDVGLLVF